MPSRRIRTLTTRLQALGGTFCVQVAKYCDPNDPLENQVNGRKTWHVHPNAAYPHQNSVQRFDTLDQLEDWLDEWEDTRDAYGPGELD